MKIFHHSDNDGKCAGFWVKELAPRDEYPLDIFKIDYGIDFPFDSIHENEIVYIVDYSIPPEEMDRLLEITPNVVWIDHHITAIQKYDNYDKEIAGLRYDGIAGCMLTYCYLSLMTNKDNVKIHEFDPAMVTTAPYFTKLIADYDVWAFVYGDDTRFFEKGFSLYPHEPDAKIWEELYDEDISSQHLSLVNTMIDQGKTITAYRHNMMEDYCEKKGFEATILDHEDIRCYAVNMAMIGSDDFIVPDITQYDVLVGFSYDGKMWSYSLRSAKPFPEVDVSKIAEYFGGGGHKAAAGFSSDKLVLSTVEVKNDD